jgi:glycosyltransferase involved in cell wall biosynthesis
MKIGFFTDGYLPQPNGVAVSVETCAMALEKRGHEVYVIAPKYPFYKDKNKHVIRIPSIKIPNQPEYRLATFFPNKSLLVASRIDFDIIHGHSGGPVTFLGWEVARLKRVPFLITYHTMWNQYTHYILKGKIVKPHTAEIVSRIFGNLCDGLVVPSEKVKDDLLSYGIEKTITIIPNGLQLERFGHEKRGFLRKKYRIPEHTKLLLYVGRVGKEKSLDYLLRAFRTIHQEEEDSTLVIVGEGSETNELKNLAKKLGINKSVIFTGKVDQKYIEKVYADADVFVFSSKSETQGLVIYEALASGVPVVAVADRAFTGIIKNGETGFLIEGTPREFAKTTLRLLKDRTLAETIAKNGKKSMEHYSVDAVAEQLEELYKTLIAKNSKKIDSPFRQLSKYLLSD